MILDIPFSKMSICRVCLGSKPRKNITDLIPVENDGKQSYEIMLFCLGIQIVNDSKVSTKLCTKCFKKIIEFHQFKLLALKSDAHLRSLDLQHPKNEPIDTNIIKTESFECSDNPVIHIQCAREIEAYDESPIEVKEECTQEDQSDDAPLDVKNITYEYVEDRKINAPVIKKTIQTRAKNIKTRKKIKKELKSTKAATKAIKGVCSECGKQVNNLEVHLKKHLPHTKPKCDLCDKVFQSSRGYQVHYKRKHTDNAKTQCSLCDAVVLNLKLHIQTMHEPKESRQFQCVSCGKKFVNQGILNAHLAVHRNDRPFQCDLCGHSFRTNRLMLMHKRRVHQKEKRFECNMCPKRFFKKERLVTHLRLHTKEKPYQCPDCDKAFMSSATLKSHRYIHGKKKFFCTLCKMSFLTPKYLRAHTLTHTKEKRYPCQFCEVIFYRSDHRNRHQLTAHLQKRENTLAKVESSPKPMTLPKSRVPQ